MDFDPQVFLAQIADAYNSRDPDTLRSFFALDDPRFAVFEDYAGALFDGQGYGTTLESVADATARMSFEMLRCDRFDDFAVIHAVQKVADKDEEAGISESRVRATLWVSNAGESPRIVTAHFSVFPDSG